MLHMLLSFYICSFHIQFLANGTHACTQQLYEKRMRRGIDIDAGCGQLSTGIKKKEDALLLTPPETGNLPLVGVYEDEEEEYANDEILEVGEEVLDLSHGSLVDFSIEDGFINLDDEDDAEDFLDPTFEDEFELAEADRLVALVKGTTLQQSSPSVSASTSDIQDATTELPPQPTTKSTTITDEEAIRKAKRRRKKLMKQLKAIQKLKDMESAGKQLNQEQLEKIAKEKYWTVELESVEHNLM